MVNEHVESIYEYIAQSATPDDGGVYWCAFGGPKGRPERSPGLYTGAAGVCYFLVDYYHKSGREAALELAESGLKWALRQTDTNVIDLGAGWAGVGSVCLKLAEATRQSGWLETACGLGERILSYEPGPALQYPEREDDRATDLFRGAAGEGLYLLRLHEATHDRRFLEGAVRNASWLSEVAIRTGAGCHWTIYTSMMSEPPPVNRHLGFCHGAAGIGHFLVQLHRVTDDSNTKSLINEIIELFLDQAITVPGGLNWPMQVGERDADRSQWCHGSAGIGLFLTTASRQLDHPDCLRLAIEAAEATYVFADGLGSPIQCHGISGNGELFLEMYRTTQDERWLDRVKEFADLLPAYRLGGAIGSAWQSDEPGLTSVSYSCGAAGIGHFLLRADEPDRFLMPFS